MTAALPIETERLVLRQFEMSDLEAILAYHSLAEVARYQYWSERTREELEIKLKAWMELDGSEAADAKLNLACVLKAEGRLIGDVIIGMTDEEARQAEIGYSFNPAYHGKGYGSEAVAKLLEIGFEMMGMHRIFGRCDARNKGSWKLMERLGMRREAHFREHAIFKGDWDEEFYYAILEDEWRAQQEGRH